MRDKLPRKLHEVTGADLMLQNEYWILNELCACAIKQSPIRLAFEVAEGCYIVQWRCTLLQFVTKSRLRSISCKNIEIHAQPCVCSVFLPLYVVPYIDHLHTSSPALLKNPPGNLLLFFFFPFLYPFCYETLRLLLHIVEQPCDVGH